MKRISLVTLATLGLAILACGGGDEEGGGDATTATAGTTTGTTAEPVADTTHSAPAAVPITDPWKSMHLPINNGTVAVSDKTHLLVVYNEGAISTYTTSYGQKIEKAGWKQKDDYSEADFTAILYTKGSQELGFAVGHFEGQTVVYFEDLDGVPQDQRVVRKGAAKSHLVRETNRRAPAQRKRTSTGSSTMGCSSALQCTVMRASGDQAACTVSGSSPRLRTWKVRSCWLPSATEPRAISLVLTTKTPQGPASVATSSNPASG